MNVRRCAFFLTIALWAGSAGYAQDLVEKLRAEFHSAPHPSIRSAAYVINLDSGSVVFAENADQPLVPASNAKLFVMAAALEALGETFTFDTSLATDGSNVLVLGGGDPALGDPALARHADESVYAVYERWADKLAEAGIKAVTGNVLYDDSIFDLVTTHPSWLESDLGKWYAAPVGGLNFFNNCVLITLTPVETAGLPAKVSFEPESDVVQVRNRARSGGTGTPLLHNPAGVGRYTVTGDCPKEWPFPAVSYPEPGMLAADVFRKVLIRNGIEVKGKVLREPVHIKYDALPAGMRIVDTHRTPLESVLRRAGRNSQNLHAECLMKMLGYRAEVRAKAPRPVGSWDSGRKAVLESLTRLGIDTEDMIIADGSGLSLENRCTARQLAALLAAFDRRPSAGLFRDSLAEPGERGSLHSRLEDYSGGLWAKTGTMQSVSALSGYVESMKGDRYAFSFIFNGYLGSSRPYRDIQDRMCAILAETN